MADPCTVSGVLQDASGALLTSTKMTFQRTAPLQGVDGDLVAPVFGTGLAATVTVTTHASTGAFSVDLMPGVYKVAYQGPAGLETVGLTVPAAEDATLAAIIGQATTIDSSLASQALASAAAAAASATAAAASAAEAEATAETLGDLTTLQGLVTDAEAAQLAAETARDAAFVNADVYADTAAGLAGTAEGDQFQVVSGAEIIRYRHDAGPVATEVARYPNGEWVSDRLNSAEVPGFAHAFEDDAGNVSGGVKDDGALRFGTANFDTVEISSAGTIAGDGATLFAEVIDASGNVASGYDEVGNFHVASLRVTEINGVAAASFGGGGTSRSGGRFLTQDAMIIATGQSLGEGSTPAISITTAQEYDSVGFVARAADYAVEALVPLTVANCGVTSRGENPMFGAAGAIKALMAAENGLAPADLDYRLIGVNTAYGGYLITQLNQGTAPYDDGIAAATRAKALADADGRTFAVRAVTWTQGEADAVTPTAFATYRDALIQLAEDYDTDLKAATSQDEPVYLITYQTGTRDQTIAYAQLEAMHLSPLIVMACPMYQFEYGDAVHIVAASSKWLGGYYGLAYKRVVIDAQPWEPLMPVAAQFSGSVIDVTFNKSGLVFDTTSLPAQTNMGFSVQNGSGTEQTISSVAILQPNRVRITLSSGTPAAGWTVKYGAAEMTGRSDAYEGGGGNLRDRAGDALTYNSNRMDNWAVLFNWTL